MHSDGKKRRSFVALLFATGDLRRSPSSIEHLGFMHNALQYYCEVLLLIYMIKSFACKETQKIFERHFSRKLPPNIQKKARLKLLLIDAATNLNDLIIPPGNRLEELKGDRKGQHSIRINNQWRICFVWKEGDAYHVEITDYH